MTSIEMSKSGNTKHTTLVELLEQAAKRKYGNSIRVIKPPWVSEQFEKLNFEVSVVAADPKPEETKRTIVDINMKEYTNRSEKEVDETLVRVKKRSTESTGSRYSFSTTKGVNWGVGGNIGAQVMGLAMVGGSGNISANYGRSKSKTEGSETTESKAFEFCYEQEENIKVPPRCRVEAKITTYSMKYEQGYTLKFSLPTSHIFSIAYKTMCQQMFCGFNIRSVTAAEFCATLPDFCQEDGKVSFTQQGTLSWVGEGSVIDKEVHPLEL